MALEKAEKSDLRIVAGSLKGRKVTVLVHPGMRPTPQMVREALFSILGNAVPGRVFYDIFAGSGVVGLEAISRGASRANLIERDAKQASDIFKYITQFKVADKASVLRADVYRWAERWVPPVGSGPVNLFLSPPFADLQPEKIGEFMKLVIGLLDKAPDESVLTIQAEDGFPVEQLVDLPAWDVRQYGRNMLLFRVKGDVVVEPTPKPD